MIEELGEIKAGKVIIVTLPEKHKKKLIQLGLISGVVIEVLNNTKGNPFLLRVMSRSVAIGKNIGKEIIVRKMK